MDQARRFEFTTEERSYGAWLGKTNDLGAITAVFFRERLPQPVVPTWLPRRWRSAAPDAEARQGAAPGGESPAPAANERPSGAGAPAAEAKGASRMEAMQARQAAADEYAATGIGRRVDHGVRQVRLDLEASPAASISIRYEFRAQLVRLGVLPDTPARLDPLDRRERARGFDDGFCPEPRRPW